jgi:signal transduction histidine kinase
VEAGNLYHPLLKTFQISHELRSPLHGILAAAEFLEDTNLDSFQKSLTKTQVICGRTLLQVIEHVLDYSKINSFEKVILTCVGF